MSSIRDALRISFAFVPLRMVDGVQGRRSMTFNGVPGDEKRILQKIRALLEQQQASER